MKKTVPLFLILTFFFAKGFCDEFFLTEKQNTGSSEKDIDESASEFLLEKFRITEVEYLSSGKTNVRALEQKIKFDGTKIFSSRAELNSYVESLVTQINNLRVIEVESFRIESSVSEYIPSADSTNINGVTVKVTVKETLSFLALPKPAFDSNSGFEFKLKAKDQNFLGTLETFNFDLNANIGTKDNPWDFSKNIGDVPVSFGFNFDYKYPFSAGKTYDYWTNKINFSWTIGESVPDFSVASGIEFTLPFTNFTLCSSFTQSIAHKNSYTVFDDQLYFAEKAALSSPIKIFDLNHVPVIYEPELSFIYNWDSNGISESNSDLKGSVTKLSNKIKFENINWNGNFRNGYSAAIAQDFSFNSYSKNFIPCTTAEYTFHKGFKHFAISSRGKFHWQKNDVQNIGENLRGTRDWQYFKNTNTYALSTDSALQLSVDVPFRIITTDWTLWTENIFGWSRKNPNFMTKVLSYLDFELQVSPFADLALTNNSERKNYFSPKDGYYNAGAEILVYPLKWKSYVVRASFGYDLSSKLGFTNKDFRDAGTDTYEIYIGLGLQY